MNNWKKEWLEKNGFKWISDNSYIYEFENFELEVKVAENGMYMANVIPDATWEFTNFQQFKSPKEAVLHAIEAHKELEKIIREENAKLEAVQFV